MKAHNEQQARQLLALGLDEFGHHTEAANVRGGIDLDDYKVDLWAIRAALDSQPAAAPAIDLSEVPRYTLAHGDFTSEMLEHSQGAWVRLCDVESVLIDASPKGGSTVVAELVEAISAFKGKRGAFMALGAQDARTVRLWSALARVQASDAEVRP
jgi:hypothetical protein